MKQAKLANSKLVDEQAGVEDCARCLGQGRAPVFEDRDGVRMPVGTGHATAWPRSNNLVEIRTETIFR
jgi:hypothetical protein